MDGYAFASCTWSERHAGSSLQHARTPVGNLVYRLCIFYVVTLCTFLSTCTARARLVVAPKSASTDLLFAGVLCGLIYLKR